ncbi:MAG TPA: fibronectin type III domain-containing protein, partial [Puia sp.]|nr:fibronectin type III domain-containing protein [Puia sp.]
ITGFTVTRDAADPRHAHIQWPHTTDADFYIVRYGIAPQRLFGNYQVYNADSLDIRALNTGVKYYFTVDAVNGSGITRGTTITAR